ncbi:MAG TPA: efflux RND transporter periplasmic adaptor subunit [Acidobacteriota bacterium]|nr:efflux RND transporter periplasmic adaptor subunit [Acidobacteriota bacterium]
MKIRTRSVVLGVIVAAAVVLYAACKGNNEAGRAAGSPGGTVARAEDAPPGAEKQLYHCPMHPTYTSDKPGDCPICGMKLVPTEREEAPAAAPPPAPKKKTMYRSTMMPNEVSDKPGKDSMGMDMVPFEVEEGGEVSEVGGRIRVKISAERQQLIGVKTAQAAFQEIHKLIRAVGRVDYAEPNLSFVNLKYDGWVEKLYVNSTGRAVRKGEPLFDLYSPDLVAAQQEYLIALKSRAALGDPSSILQPAREKLRLWGVTDAQIEELGKTGEARKTLTVYSPASGIVVEKDLFQGQKVMSGENLFKIADLSTVWIIGEVYEYELPFLKTGQEVMVSLSYYPGEAFGGKIAYIYPYLKPETRTNPIRIEVANPGLKLKPEMFANLEIRVDYGTKLAVPISAVLDAGGTKIVFVTAGDGYFEPREVKLGVRGDEFYEVQGGVGADEAVVTSANFLIDSESSLKAALARMAKPAAGDEKHD